MSRLSWTAAVPTRDRPASLARLIDALLAQQLPPRQIVIIDDGELETGLVDGWAERARSAGVAWVYRRKERPGRSVSRNLAIDLADGDAVIFFDDDCEPVADFADRLIAALEADPTGLLVAVEGQTQPPGGPDARGRLYDRMIRLFGLWRLRPRGPRGGELPPGVERADFLGGVCAVRRAALVDERFDPELTYGEDRELSQRLSRRGLLGRVGGAVCVHHEEAVGRVGRFALGVRIARNYLRAQAKLFGPGGWLLGAVGLLLWSLMELGMTLGGRIGHAKLSAGLLVGLLTPTARAGERKRQ
ncbi:MAG: hypothetical protein BIFFINMI_01419 [Phycisphaerae bacterium]|nr:hypothetical protein [Phycisphaerae bacterium]